MIKKYALPILTVIFIVSLLSALYLSFKQAEELRIANSQLEFQVKSLMITDAIKSKSLIQLRDLRGNIDSYWLTAENSGRIEDYVSFLERAIDQDNHYQEALDKLRNLIYSQGYIQITDSNGTNYITQINNINTENSYYKVFKAMSIRNGVIGYKGFKNTSRNGDIVRQGDVIQIIKKYNFNSGAQWAKIKYQKQNQSDIKNKGFKEKS